MAALATLEDGRATTYRFTSEVGFVISPRSPSAVSDVPFAIGQPVAGSFRYTPDSAMRLNPPSDHFADFSDVFSDLRLTIGLGDETYRFNAPEIVPPGNRPFAGLQLNTVSVNDNVATGDGGESDSFTLRHSNPFAFDQVAAPVDPSAIVGSFYPVGFSFGWFSDSPVGARPANFITDFSLPADLNELFGQSQRNNWAFQVSELPISFDPNFEPGRLVNVLGRITTLEVIPEPCCLTLVAVLIGWLSFGRGSRFELE